MVAGRVLLYNNPNRMEGATIFNLLGGKYVDDKIKDIYRNMKLNTFRIQVALGVNRTFEDVPHLFKYIFDSPFTTSDGSQYNNIDA